MYTDETRSGQRIVVLPGSVLEYLASAIADAVGPDERIVAIAIDQHCIILVLDRTR